jgi:FlaA1/EpsC-like NDP-sugar epimerase
MGTTKQAAEIACQICAEDYPDTKLIVVRFGNVLGSIGSVISLFKKKIALGVPVTVTHEEVVRYFMLIPEACQLVM